MEPRVRPQQQTLTITCRCGASMSVTGNGITVEYRQTDFLRAHEVCLRSSSPAPSEAGDPHRSETPSSDASS